MAGLILLVVIGTAIWVGYDAQDRDFSSHSFAKSTAAWVAGTLLLWIVVFPMYVVARGRVPVRRVVALEAVGAVPVSWADSATKTCPECAEPIRAAARKCRFCGHRLIEEIA